ncbi:hypothetical protein GAGA_3373 [Paraglaciecola agarilytica NO2]|uniref:Sel1 repeat family protein n=1 Tax=Paraglaciecola agarilytica NO2 TaxID=1125747 RepID=A0ABQ0IAC2_9ALTE|nr:hypothetical protein GAGA_3373 [Paraglaciecola agarilytica NO2]
MPQDHKAAAIWFERAAKQGNASAQKNLGSMYEIGEGVPLDHKAAVTWYERAAEQGNTAAQISLGVMYARGEGLLQDYVKAHMWFNIAAANGVSDATVARTKMAELMVPSQIQEAQKLAREWTEKY